MTTISRYFGKLKEWLLDYPAIPVLVIVCFVIMAIFANHLAPYSPYEANLPARFLPPFWEPGGSISHILGTDGLGRDLLSRIVMGARLSLAVAFISLIVGGGIGTIVGVSAGYFGGWVDSVLMRMGEVILAFPLMLLGMLLAITMGANFQNLIIAICIVLWARYSRIIRGEVISVKEYDFVALAKVAGRPHWWIMVHHIFPNVLNTVVVLLTLNVGWIILVEATLSFLGAGIPPPYPAWGSMVAEGRSYLTSAWWVSTFPGISILLTALSFNLFGDWLREALDPRMRESIGGA